MFLGCIEQYTNSYWDQPGQLHFTECKLKGNFMVYPLVSMVFDPTLPTVTVYCWATTNLDADVKYEAVIDIKDIYTQPIDIT